MVARAMLFVLMMLLVPGAAWISPQSVQSGNREIKQRDDDKLEDPPSFEAVYSVALMISKLPAWPQVSTFTKELPEVKLEEKEWQRLYRTGHALQRTDKQTVMLGVMMYRAIASHSREFGGHGSHTKTMLLFRVMFELPEDEWVWDERNRHIRPFDGLSWRFVQNEEEVLSLALPIQWHEDGPRLIAANEAAGGMIAAEPHTIYHYFNSKYKDRRLHSYLNSESKKWLSDKGFSF